MGCSPSSPNRRQRENMLALAVAQETLLLQQQQQNLTCRDPVWLEASPESIMPPAYSEQAPPGHTSYAGSYTPNHIAGQSEVSTPRTTPGYPESPYSVVAAAPATPPPPLRSTGSRRGSRVSQAPETSPHSPSSPRGGDDPQAPRRRLRARRRISPMPMQSPPSRSSLRSNEDSEAQAALLAMTRPVASTHQRADSASAAGAASASPGHGQGRQQRGASPGERHRNAANNHSGPGAGGAVDDDDDDDDDDNSKLKDDAGNAEEKLLNTLVESVSDVNLHSQQTPATATTNASDSVCHISYTPTDTAASAERQQHPGGQQSADSAQQAPEAGDIRRVLFPSSQHRTSVARSHQTPWHEQMLAVGGKRARSERGGSSCQPSHRHGHRRHSTRSNSTTERPIGVQQPAAGPAIRAPPRSHSLSRIPPLPGAKNRIDIQPLRIATDDKPAIDGSDPVSSPVSTVTAAPHLRPVRTREFQRLPPMENSNNTGAALPNVLSRRPHISSQSLSRKPQHRFITRDVQTMGY